MTLLMSTMLHLLLVDGTLWLVHHLNPRVDVRCSWKKKLGLSLTKIVIVIIRIIVTIITIIWTITSTLVSIYEFIGKKSRSV